MGKEELCTLNSLQQFGQGKVPVSLLGLGVCGFCFVCFRVCFGFVFPVH